LLKKKRHGGGNACRSTATVGFFLMRDFKPGQRCPRFVEFCVASDAYRLRIKRIACARRENYLFDPHSVLIVRDKGVCDKSKHGKPWTGRS
jgi:hypothetical protein